MSEHENRYEITRREIPDPDGNLVCFFEVDEIFLVHGEEMRHKNADEKFKTEQEARDWINNQSSG